MVVTVEGWFIAVVGAWWGGSAEQGEQIQPPMSPGKHGPENGCREPGAGGGNPLLAADALD